MYEIFILGSAPKQLQFMTKKQVKLSPLKIHGWKDDPASFKGFQTILRVLWLLVSGSRYNLFEWIIIRGLWDLNQIPNYGISSNDLRISFTHILSFSSEFPCQ